MRRMSDKRKQLVADSAAKRLAFKLDHPKCMICGRDGTDTHEIARGAHREQSYGEREAWLQLCRFCHSDVSSASEWPVARQLALKKAADPDYYNRVMVNNMRGRHVNAISEGEVDAHLASLPDTTIWKYPHRRPPQ